MRTIDGSATVVQAENVFTGEVETVAVPAADARRVSSFDQPYALPAFVDAHRHFPHGWRPDKGNGLGDARMTAVTRAVDEGLGHATDMGVGVVEGWPTRPSWVESALAGIRDATNDDAVGFGVAADARGIGRTVERLAEAGAQLIKIFATGSGKHPRDRARERSLSREQIHSAAAAAREAGLRVVAHCHGGPALSDCVEAGVASIEHGLHLTRDELCAIRDAGVQLTLTPGVYIARLGEAAVEALHAVVAGAMDIGVEVRVGTDTPHESIAQQIHHLIGVGLPAEVAVRAATMDSDATAVRILFSGDPTKDPVLLLNPLGTGKRS